MAKIRPVTLTPLMLCCQIIFMHTSASDITLVSPQTTIKAAIGEELKITCLALKCSNKDPSFTWSSLEDKYLSGNAVTVEKRSILTMEVRAETDGTYRCTVSCDNAPSEKSFTIIVYSFPSDPVLQVSSLVVGQPSRITCIFPSIYPAEWLSAEILLNDKNKAQYQPDETEAVNQYEIQNISLTHDLTLVEEMDQYEIQCLATLNSPYFDAEPIQRHKSQTLHLMYPPVEPEIVVRPSTIVKAGEGIHLLCLSDSKSPVVIQWVKQIGDVEHEMPSDDQGSLILSNTEPDNSGVYICYAQNSAGKTSSWVEINVQGLPENPMLSLMPASRVVAGEAVTIECIASGDANVTLWKISEDGETFSLDSAGKVVIDEADAVDAAVYRCTAENQYGVSEMSESLTVEYPPRETILSSSSIDVNEGDTVILTCVSQGVPTPDISISKLLTTGESVLLSEDPVIALDKVTSGIYQCLANNRLGTEKNKLEINVRVPPKNTFITITPSHTVRNGDSVHIRCLSDASPAPKLVLKMKTDVGMTELESEHGLYSIPYAAVEHTGAYLCEASNVIGAQVAEATLTVQAAPKNTKISITPSSVVRGDSVHIRCTSEASPAPTLALKIKTEHDLVDLVAENGEYIISHAEERHIGIYSCESTNVAGSEIVEATLSVQAAPKNTQISITPSSVVREGDSVHIRCTSEASPAPTLALKIKTEHDLVDLVAEGGEYIISHAEERHIGIYICESTNVVGSEIVEATLNVQVPPRNTYITITPSEVVREGDIVQIWCSSEGSPEPELVLRMRTEDDLLSSLVSSDGFYNISHAGVENTGTYICESTNVVGLQVARNTLTVQIPPRNTTVVVTPSQNIIEGDTVTITCETHSIPSPTIILQKVCDEDNTVLQTQNGTFTLHNVTRNDTGTYTLKIFNSAGNETEVINIIVAGRQQSPRFNPTSIIIFGSVAFMSVGVIGSIIYHLKKTKLQGSYSLVKALRSKV